MNKLSEIAKIAGTDKFWYHNYTEFYYDYFKELKSPKVLELGTAGHGSTKMFLDFFGDCRLVGMDIVNFCDFKDPRFRFVHGDQSNLDDLKKCVDDEPFDLILDDGGHTMKQQQTSFGYLFNHMKPQGIYAMEDLHTSFNGAFIEDPSLPTTYEMLMKIKNKETSFSGYISKEDQEKILDRVDWIEIYAKNPDDLKDSVTSIIKFK